MFERGFPYMEEKLWYLNAETDKKFNIRLERATINYYSDYDLGDCKVPTKELI